MASALEFSGLTIGRGRTVVAAGLQAALLAGEFVCLLGPNGAGKTTLLRTLAGQLPPLAGTVRLEGADLTDLAPAEVARCLAVVLTERRPAGLLRVRDLVALGRHPHTDWLGRLGSRDREIVQRSMEVAGVAGLAERQAGSLSDGELQKAFVARALAQEPCVLLLDEPTAFLDLPRRVELMRMLRRLATDRRLAVLCASHDLDLALWNADRLWLLPPGGPFLSGAPEDLALEGALDRLFGGSSLRLDPGIGSFRVVREDDGRRIGLSGTGPAALWTWRALERSGFHIVEDECGPRITLEEGVDGPCWRLVDGAATEFRSIGELVRRLADRKGKGEEHP